MMDKNVMGNKENLELKRMCQLKRTIAVNIEFQDLTYTVRNGISDKKYILKSVNGQFVSGELTGILGSSGSGKTSLVNILSGYSSKGMSGDILINGNRRNMNIFRKMSAYILQDSAVQEHLSVEELMMMAAQLKLPGRISYDDKNTTVLEVLNLLGLTSCLNTWTEFLSGGERKRLTIALELINNPTVLFLDEPTSGLDNVSAMQCMKVLKVLSEQGKTVVCTIHQPSPMTFQSLDQVYFLHDGKCIYNGNVSNMIPFLSSCEYPCPITHSPEEHIIEMSHIFKESSNVFAEQIKNGKLNRRDYSSNIEQCLERSSEKDNNLKIGFETTFWTQFVIILSRMMLLKKRAKTVLILLVISHVPLTILAGGLFYQIGNDAKYALLNFNFCLAVMIFFSYIYLMSAVVIYPFEVRLLRREYTNHWYGLKPYFLALTIRNLPVMLPLGIVYSIIMYLLSGHPLEIIRFLKFTTAALLLAVASEGLGIAIASVCSVTRGAITAAILIAPLIVLCVYGMGAGNVINPFIETISYSSYLRLGIVAMFHTLFSDRGRLGCSEDVYCHYQDPKDILREANMLNVSYSSNIIGLVIFNVLIRLLGFFLLRFRLTPEYYRLVNHYINRVLKR